MIILGVDLGGSGIKGALVDTQTGELVSERIRIETPQPATPKAIANTLQELVKQFQYSGPIGCGFPATVHHGITFTAANIDSSWINTKVEKLFTETIKNPCYVLNDADAAGIAEMKFGEGKDHNGVVMMITIGTGLGSAIFVNQNLIPNTELGHLILNDQIAEHYCSDAARQKEDLSWNKWGKRFNKYLSRLQFLFNPDLIILGGGASKHFEKYQEKIKIRTPVTTAKTLNTAGIIGAALYAQDLSTRGQLPHTSDEELDAIISADNCH
jgi:polyphosphate glucokinase